MCSSDLGRRVARHPRSYGRHQEVLDLEHYLDVLERKPGALAGSKPLDQWRRAGRWPESYDRFWTALIERQGRQAGTKAMIELLQLGRRLGQERGQAGYDRLRAAVEAALALGCSDAAAVRHLLASAELARQRPATAALAGQELGRLAGYDRPLPEVTAYDQLLLTAAAPPAGAAAVMMGGRP